MNKYLFFTLAIIAVPFVVIYMWVRHPKKVWAEARKSWRMINHGEQE